MRAKKFGAPLSAEAKKLVRAERFSEAGSKTTTNSETGAKKITISNSVSTFHFITTLIFLNFLTTHNL